MQLGTRFALALLLTSMQFSVASADDVPTAKVVQKLTSFSSDEGLGRLARSTAKADFPLLANSHSPIPRSAALHQQRSY